MSPRERRVQVLSPDFRDLVESFSQAFSRSWDIYKPGIYFPAAGRFAEPPQGGWRGADPDLDLQLAGQGLREAYRGLFGAAAASIAALRTQAEAIGRVYTGSIIPIERGRPDPERAKTIRDWFRSISTGKKVSDEVVDALCRMEVSDPVRPSELE
jgi:hypothetical protein